MNEKEVLKFLAKVMDKRDWAQCHSAENLAKRISIESAELLTLFQLSCEDKNKVILDELADILTYCFMLAHRVRGVPSQLFKKVFYRPRKVSCLQD